MPWNNPSSYYFGLLNIWRRTLFWYIPDNGQTLEVNSFASCHWILFVLIEAPDDSYWDCVAPVWDSVYWDFARYMKISFKEQCSCKLVFMCHFDLMVRFWNMFSLKKAQSSVVVSTHTKKCRQFRFNMRLCHFNYSSCSIVACKANLIALGMSLELTVAPKSCLHALGVVLHQNWP